MSGPGTVIVSGGTYGIGRAITVELAVRGWSVLAFGLETRQPGSTARDGIAGTRAALDAVGLDAELMDADVADEVAVAAVVERALDRFGRIDALVNNAAIRPVGTVLDTDPSVFDRVLAVNLKGPYLMCRVAIPHLRKAGGGSIVNIGSGAGRGKPGIAAYSASKGGLFALSAALAEDHRVDNIRVNVVVPGPRTPSGMVEEMTELAGPAGLPPSTAGHSSSAEEVAHAVAELLVGEATGTVRDLGVS